MINVTETMASYFESPLLALVAMLGHVLSLSVNRIRNDMMVYKYKSPQSYRRRPIRYNSAIRLCYSLQLLPVVNQKHDLRTVPPAPSACSVLEMPSPRRRTHPSASSKSSSASTTTAARTDQNGVRRQSGMEEQSRSILWVVVIFALASYLLYFLSRGITDEDTHETQDLKFPTNMSELSDLARFLSHFKEKHWNRVLVLFVAAYIYKQTFAIPGSVFMNVLSGALFGPWAGFALTAVLSAVGATSCYILSKTFGRGYVVRWFPQRVQFFQQKIEENRDGLLFFLLFLRLFPMSPNWLMNMIAPIVGVPIHLFFLSVFIGLMPYTFVCAQTGSVLSQVSSLDDIFSTWTMFSMALAALAALLPGLVIRRMQQSQRHSTRR